MSKVYVGIDIGKHGAIAIMSVDQSITYYPMPKIKDEIDYNDLSHLLKGFSNIGAHVVFEKLGVIFGSSKTTAFSMGHQAGAIEMGCIAHGISFTKVRAVDWQKQMFQGVETITKTGKSNKDTKAMALIAVKRIFPDLKLTFGDRATKAHDGLVDAVLLAEYARRNNL